MKRALLLAALMLMLVGACGKQDVTAEQIETWRCDHGNGTCRLECAAGWHPEESPWDRPVCVGGSTFCVDMRCECADGWHEVQPANGCCRCERDTRRYDPAIESVVTLKTTHEWQLGDERVCRCFDLKTQTPECCD